MVERPGYGVAPWDEVLARVVEAIELSEASPTQQIVRVIADQPLAARPVWGENGVARTERVFMGLAPGASPRLLGTTTVVSSWGSFAGAIYMGATPPPDWLSRGAFVTENVPGLLTANVGDTAWLEPEPIRDDLRDAKSALLDLVDYEQHRDVAARKRAESYIGSLWPDVVTAPVDPSTGCARPWIGGVQAACAQAAMVVLQTPRFRTRLRRCPRCDTLLFTSSHAPGLVRDACPGHGAADTARDARRKLRQALRVAGCPRFHDVARAVLRHCSTVRELRDAAVGDQVWLHEEIGSAAAAELRSVGRQARTDDIEQVVAGVVRRMRTPPRRRRGALDPWVERAFDELGLPHDSPPTEKAVHAAYEEMTRRAMKKRELFKNFDLESELQCLRDAHDDALFLLLARPNGRVS